MTRDQVLAVLQGAVATVLEVPPASVTPNLHFVRDLEADSLAIVEIVEILEEELTSRARPGFVIDDADLDGLLTVGDALDYAVARL